MEKMENKIKELTELYAKHGIELTIKGKTATLKKGLITIKRSVRKR